MNWFTIVSQMKASAIFVDMLGGGGGVLKLNGGQMTINYFADWNYVKTDGCISCTQLSAISVNHHLFLQQTKSKAETTVMTTFY